jgi:DNA (cytosine-5)-methyltransferase 1
MKINQLDLFSGIGGFHLGFEKAGYKVTSYFSEIDKHAVAVYKNKFKNSNYVGSVTDVRGADLPKIDLITFGSPCQDFSLAGKRKGMEGDRSSLILEAIRLIGECRPRVFIWENVKGTFSSNSGEDFSAIIQAFANIGGYRLEWQLLNTSWFLPQNRERIYLVGYSTEPKRDWRGVFPIGSKSESDYQLSRQQANTNTILQRYGNDAQGSYIIEREFNAQVKQVGTRLDSNNGTQPYQQDRVYDADGIVPALNKGKSDLILRVKSATNSGYEEATSGDTINLAQPNSETRRGRVGKQKAQTLETSCNQAVVEVVSMKWQRTEEGKRSRKESKENLGKDYTSFSDRELIPSDRQISNTITSFVEKDALIAVVQPNYSSKSLNETIEQNTLTEGEPKALDLYNRQARDESPTLTEPHHNSLRLFDGYRIRRLTPIECERLQGFPDQHTAYGNYDGEVKLMANNQRYKQCGNAVTVDVVEAIANKIKPLFK